MNYVSKWKERLHGRALPYPAEYVIRIFKGAYPRLELKKENYKDAKICDVGCGDGRHLVFLKILNFQVYGVEIDPDIVTLTKNRMQQNSLDIDVRVGKNDSLPFKNNYFDYLLSWNSCYYMGDKRNFDENVKEFSRVLRPGAILIMSIPQKSCFIFKDSVPEDKGYVIIKKDPFNMRNGAIFRIFKNASEIKSAFSKYFTDFSVASIYDDCFGYAYHWHIICCIKK